MAKYEQSTEIVEDFRAVVDQHGADWAVVSGG